MSDQSNIVVYPDCSAGAQRQEPEVIENWLGDPPPWRKPDAGDNPGTERKAPELRPKSAERGETYITTSENEQDAINVALLLRRPLLVTGPPGIGKSTLAYSIACALGLGEPLRWEINSRTTLADGLYRYDAVGHLHSDGGGQKAGIQEYITLGPLGTAMVPHEYPRVLLIDELDKASYDLPNDLLHILEEARFHIPELRKEKDARVQTSEGSEYELCDGSMVQSHHHPVVIITSNGEREFPAAFRRRCVSLDLPFPGETKLRAIVEKHLAQEGVSGFDAIWGELKEDDHNQATDYVLQASRLKAMGLDIDTIKRALKRSKG